MEPDTREKILDAAEGIYCTFGSKGMTTRKVASAAGVSELTLFRHFVNKQGLLDAVAQRCGTITRMDKVLAEATTGDLTTDLCIIAEAMTAGMKESHPMIRMSIAECGMHPETTAIASARPRAAVARLAAFFQERMDAGQVRRDDPVLIAHAFSGMFFARSLAGPLFEGIITQSEKDVIDAFVRIFVNGVAAPARETTHGRSR